MKTEKNTGTIAFRFRQVLQYFVWARTRPQISIKHIDDLCNTNQLVSLFILSLFLQSTSTCFGHVYSPSSGGILYIYTAAAYCHGRDATQRCQFSELTPLSCMTICCSVHKSALTYKEIIFSTFSNQ